jgi:uncharacterized protein
VPTDLACPNDGTELVALERSGVTIDACPRCRGVWLERGELDKILAREREEGARADDDFVAEMTGRKGGGGSERDDDRSSFGRTKPKKKKKRGLLEEFLDFE